jgi:hypothetical protein
MAAVELGHRSGLPPVPAKWTELRAAREHGVLEHHPELTGHTLERNWSVKPGPVEVGPALEADLAERRLACEAGAGERSRTAERDIVEPGGREPRADVDLILDHATGEIECELVALKPDPPDGGLHRDTSDRVYYSTAVLVIEIVSPGDESWEKLPFYAAHEVEELLIIDPQERTVSWMGIEAGDYQHVKRSRVIELGAEQLAGQIDWP